MLKKMKSWAIVALTASAGTLAIPGTANAGANPLLGEMMLFAGNFCPRGWTQANGSLLPISQNTALFSILGTTYGGDGRTTFGIPDLQGRAPIGDGNGAGLNPIRLGQKGGASSTVITEAQMPSHTHVGRLAAHPTDADSNQPVRNGFARASTGTNVYKGGALPNNFMNGGSVRIDSAGSGQAISTQSPFLGMRWCIATQGVFPSRN